MRIRCLYYNAQNTSEVRHTSFRRDDDAALSPSLSAAASERTILHKGGLCLLFRTIHYRKP